VYSHTTRSTMADTLPAVAPLPDEPNVVSSANKFNNTNLQQLLTAKGIKTVIVTGVSAEGAVMFTGSQAAFLGYNVIVPVDGMSSETPYALQYVAWSFTHAPLLSTTCKLTTLAQIGF
jgi:nicotinamidase-related amidase